MEDHGKSEEKKERFLILKNDRIWDKKDLFPWGERHKQSLLLFLCVAIAFALRVNLSVGIVAMTEKTSGKNGIVELSWNESKKSVVLSSFFWGYAITQVFWAQMAHTYGAKHFLTCAIGISGVLTILIPTTAIHGGVVATCANRMIQGMAQSSIYPSINILMSKWAPTSERGRMVSIVFSGSQFGSLAMLSIAGLLASSASGWPVIFYASGTVALMWVIVWSIVGANSPTEHRTISEAEKQFITSSLISTTSEKVLPTPWGKIFKSLPVWTLIITHITENWSYWILQTSIPTYFNCIFKFNMKSNGFLSALPYSVMWILIIVFSWINDYIKINGFISNTVQRKMWNSIAHWGGALSLIFLYLFNTSITGAIVLLTVTIGINSGVFTGFLINHLDLAPNFAGTLLGITSTFSNMGSILGPLLVGVIVTDSSNKDQWRIVFLCTSGLLFTGNLFYVLFGSAEIQSWNDSSKNTNKNTDNINSKP